MRSPFHTEPPYTHGQAERTGVLLCNLGTPDEPTAPAVRRYLAQFLGDHRVVEIPKLVWLPILHGIILRTRPAKSAAKYASIWTPEGSPLAHWTAKQATLLRGWLGEAGHAVLVRHAMRYGNPSIASQLDALKAEGATRITLGLTDTSDTRALWPHAFDLSLAITVGRTLRLALTTRNTGDAPFRITQALHSYFAVGDIARTLGVAGRPAEGPRPLFARIGAGARRDPGDRRPERDGGRGRHHRRAAAGAEARTGLGTG